MSKKTIFIAMPYGTHTGILEYPAESGFREYTIDFDDVWTNMVFRAIQDDYEPVRADELRRTGIIDKQYIEQLFFADAVIADLTFGNANVYYELGMRQVFSKRGTVLLAQKGTRLPFDVRNQRVLEYDYFNAPSIFLFQHELKLAVNNVFKQDKDSPVHTLLGGLSVYYSGDGKDLSDEIEELKSQNEELKNRIREMKRKAEEERLLGKIISCANKAGLIYLYNEVLIRSFSSALLLETLGIKLRKYGCVNESITVFELAVNAHPQEPAFFRELGFSHRKLGPKYYTDAEIYFNKALSFNRFDAELLGMLGGMYKRKGEYEKARGYYKEAGALVDDDIYSLVNIAFTELILGNEAESKIGYQKIIDLTSVKIKLDMADYWDYLTRGEAFLITGDFDSAVAAYQEAKLQKVPVEDLRSAYEQLDILSKHNILENEINKIVTIIFATFTN